MHVFLTGAGSFIGRAFLKWCDQQNIKVTGVDLTDIGREDCQVGDIRHDSIRDLIPEGVDAIVHLAALSRDPDCRGKAFDCFDSNVMSTLRLMDIAQEKGAKQFVFSSSEWVYSHYPNGEDVVQFDIEVFAKYRSDNLNVDVFPQATVSKGLRDLEQVIGNLRPNVGTTNINDQIAKVDENIVNINETISNTETALKNFSGLFGYIGIDILLEEDQWKIIEINPRFTSSLIGLGKSYGRNSLQKITNLYLENKLNKTKNKLIKKLTVKF